MRCPECGSHNVGQKRRPKRKGEGGWGVYTYDAGISICCDCGVEFALDLPGTEPDEPKRQETPRRTL